MSLPTSTMSERANSSGRPCLRLIASRMLAWLIQVSVISAMAMVGSVHAQERLAKTGQMHVEVISQRNFDDTVNHLKWRFGDHGMVVSWASDFARIVDHSRNKVNNAVVFELVRPSWLSTIFESEPRAALSMPVRVMVVEDASGETLVSYYRISALLGVWGDSGLEEFGIEIDEKLSRVVRLATKN